MVALASAGNRDATIAPAGINGKMLRTNSAAADTPNCAVCRGAN